MRTRAAALIAVTVITGATLAACGGDDEAAVEDATDGPATSQGSEPTTPSTEPTSAAPTPEQDATDAAPTVAVPVYFVGETPQGKRLFREFRDVESDNPADEALALLGAGDALDPDYSTLWPGAGLRLVSDGATITVGLPDPSWAVRPDGMSAKDAKLAVQQVVHTVQGVLQAQSPVVFTVDDSPSAVLGVKAPATGFTAGKSLNVLGLVNVTTPAEGQSVSGTLTASGVASSFEGTVPWQVLDASGTPVLDGSAQADGWIDDLYPWEAEVDLSTLAPGTYTFVAMTDDPSGGEGGGPTEDTKTITVG